MWRLSRSWVAPWTLNQILFLPEHCVENYFWKAGALQRAARIWNAPCIETRILARPCIRESEAVVHFTMSKNSIRAACCSGTIRKFRAPRCDSRSASSDQCGGRVLQLVVVRTRDDHRRCASSSGSAWRAPISHECSVLISGMDTLHHCYIIATTTRASFT